MHLFVKKIGFVLLIFIGIAMGVAAGSLWSLRQSSFYKPSYLVNAVEEKEFDYIILGASTGLTTLNTKVIDSLIDTDGINLSMDDTALSTQYLMLQHFLAQGKSTEYCILAPSASSFDQLNSNISDNDYRFLPYIQTNYVSDYFKSFSSRPATIIEQSKWLPLFGVSYYNVEIFYPSLLTFIKPKKRNRFDKKGNYSYPLKLITEQLIPNFKKMPVTFKSEYVEKIRRLCETHNIKLICYFSPIQATKVETKTNAFTIINHSDLLKNTSLFYDAIHVNQKGRQVCSEIFANDFTTLRQ